MKNKSIKISGMILCLFGFFSIYAQEGEAIYSYDGDNIVTKSKFIGPPTFPDDYENVTPYVLKNSNLIESKSYDPSYLYWVKMYKYKGFENDPGFCNVIDIVYDKKTLLQVRDPGGWGYIREKFRKYTGMNRSNCYMFCPITKTAMALFFVGHSYQNDPSMLTIIVIDKEKAEVVFNKPMHPMELNQTNTEFSLIGHSNNPELNLDMTPVTPYIKHKIWLENGVLRFKNL